jgi:hypothetical protein
VKQWDVPISRLLQCIRPGGVSANERSTRRHEEEEADEEESE